MREIEFGSIPGLRVGHAQDREAATGCTVLLFEEGATAGVDVRGGAPGTRETDLLDPRNFVDKIHGLILAGGSAFGLDAASGVMAYLEEQNIGFDVQVARVPIVCGAVLFDLSLGDPMVRPNKAMGYQASRNARSGPVPQGSVGAGTGATVGKLLGMKRAMKGGLGCWACEMDRLKVGALVAVNCLGEVMDPSTGEKLAGLLQEDGRSLGDTEEELIQKALEPKDLFSGNTTLGAVVTNAALTKAQASKLASMAQDGLARCMRPAHTMVDGDTIFALSVGSVKAELNAVGLLAARAVEKAILSGIRNAESLGGVRSWQELHGQ